MSESEQPSPGPASLRIINSRLERQNKRLRERVERDREAKMMLRSRCARQRRELDRLREMRAPQ